MYKQMVKQSINYLKKKILTYIHAIKPKKYTQEGILSSNVSPSLKSP